MLISLNDFAEILRDFAKHFSYFAKYCRKISFAKEILSNTKFRERNFAKFRQILISRNDFVEILRNFVIWLVSKNEISQNFANFAAQIYEIKISQNFLDHPRGRPISKCKDDFSSPSVDFSSVIPQLLFCVCGSEPWGRVQVLELTILANESHGAGQQSHLEHKRGRHSDTTLYYVDDSKNHSS